MSDSTAKASAKGIGLFGLVGMTVSSCIGSGVFSLTGELAQVASPGASILTWIIVGFGFLMLALSIGNVATKRPKSDGVLMYAEDGFGHFAGFLSGWGYWLSAWLGNVAFVSIMASTLGYFFPYFLPGNNIGSVVFGTCIIWGLVLLIMQGVEQASFINALVMVVKVASLALFALTMIVMFSAGVFTADFWGNVYNNAVAAGSAGSDALPLGSITTQVVNAMLALMWCFVGIEGASVVAGRAERKTDIPKALIIGILIVIAVYVMCSILPYGYLPYTEIASMELPTMSYIFEQVFPGWGGTVMAVAMLISCGGCFLSFMILPAQTTQQMSEHHLLTSRWGKLDSKGVPRFSLIAAGICSEAFTIVMMLSEDAYNFFYSLCTVAIVITWIFAAAYQIKVGLEDHEIGQTLIGIIATAFLGFCTLASGWTYLLLVCILVVPGLLFYAAARRQYGNPTFTGGEKIAAALICVAALVAIVMLTVGAITI